MKRVYHTIDPDFRLRIAEVNAGFAPDLIGKTRQGQISNCAVYLKLHILNWADDFPAKYGLKGARVSSGFTPAVRDIFKRIVWGQNMGQGYRAFSLETLGAPTSPGKQPHTPTTYDRRTVIRAVAWLLKRGLIQVKTGGGWNRDDRRQLTNQYTPNVWPFLDPVTGGFIRPPYFSEAYPWREKSGIFRREIARNVTAIAKESAGSRGEERNSERGDKMSLGSKASKSKPKPKSSDKMSLCTVKDGDATAAPPSPGGSTGSANAPTGTKIVIYGSFSRIAKITDIPSWALLAPFGPTIGERGEALELLCRGFIFFGAHKDVLARDLPGEKTVTACLALTAGEKRYRKTSSKVTEVKTGDWLRLEYQVSEEFEASMERRLSKSHA